MNVTELSDEQFYERLQSFVGMQTGPDVPGPDVVNTPMVRHLVEVLGDRNPIYVDEAAAAASRHGGLVCPPTMLQAWVMTGIEGPKRGGESPYEQMNAMLFSRGFTSVVATNCDQTYERYLRPGDRLTMRTTIDSISPQKTTGLGTGHFVTTRQSYYDADGELVGSMTFRIIRFRPGAKPVTKPPRPPAATTHDNAFLFDGLADGKLTVQRCTDCGRRRHPPGPTCPHCQSTDWEPVEVAGTGTIHSLCVVHYPQVPSFDYPLPVLLIDLTGPDEDGLRMVMNAADSERDDLQIGAAVRIEVRPADGAVNLPFAIVTAGPGGPS